VLAVQSGQRGPRRQSWRARLRKLVLRALPALVVLAVWELGSGTLVDPFFFSKPSIIFARLIRPDEWNAALNLQVTLTEMLAGYAIGAVLGVGLGYLLGYYRRLSSFVEPYILAFYAVPRIALAPLLIIWLGIGIYSKVFMAAVMVFFMVFYNTHLGIRSVNQEYLNLARIMGATERNVVHRIVLPFIAPYIMLGLRASVPRTVIGAIVAEFVASRAGIGYYILRATGSFDAAGQFIGVIVLLAFTFLAATILSAIEARALRWTRISSSRSH
jgi:NitT/TauT family transport system permease protein